MSYMNEVIREPLLYKLASNILICEFFNHIGQRLRTDKIYQRKSNLLILKQHNILQMQLLTPLIGLIT